MSPRHTTSRKFGHILTTGRKNVEIHDIRDACGNLIPRFRLCENRKKRPAAYSAPSYREEIWLTPAWSIEQITCRCERVHTGNTILQSGSYISGSSYWLNGLFGRKGHDLTQPLPRRKSSERTHNMKQKVQVLSLAFVHSGCDSHPVSKILKRLLPRFFSSRFQPCYLLPSLHIQGATSYIPNLFPSTSFTFANQPFEACATFPMAVVPSSFVTCANVCFQKNKTERQNKDLDRAFSDVQPGEKIT